MSEHPSDAELVALIEGPTPPDAERLRAHLVSCAECLAVVTELARLHGDQTLSVPHGAGPEGALEPGTRLGRYTIVSRLGAGAMGVVYSAQDPVLNRTIAIMVLRHGATGARPQLLAEARTLAQLSHPNVSAIYDAGTEHGITWLAIEYLDGSPLRAHLKARQLKWLPMLALFRQAAAGLAAAHALGIVQRDFKPENVMVTRAGRVVVTDFGLANAQVAFGALDSRSLDEQSVFNTRKDLLVGTPAYMSPEQARGEWADAKSDQFSFCVTLYEAVLGQRPFHGETFRAQRDAVLSNTRQGPREPLAPPSQAAQARLLALLDRGLALEPKDRFRDMNALIAALDLVMQPPVKTLKRALLVAAPLLVLAAVSGAFVWAQRQQREYRQWACRENASLSGAWDDALRSRGEQAFLATNKPYAQLAWSTTRAELDAYAARWVAARVEACEATRVRGEQSEARMAARLACLDQLREGLSGLASTFASADVETVDRGRQAVGQLLAVERCASRKLEWAPVPPAQAALVHDLDVELAFGRALASAGKYDAGRERLLASLKLAQSLKLPAAEAETLLSLGRLERDARRFPEARAAFEGSVRQAEAAGDDETSARSLTALVSVVGWRLERPDDARALALWASGKLDRIGRDARIEAELAEGLGDVEWEAGRLSDSVAEYRRAMALLVATQGEESTDVARLHSSIGWVLTELGSYDEARTEITRSKAIREKLLGPDHPQLVDVWNELAGLAWSIDETAEAASCYRRAIDGSRLSLGADSLATAGLELNLAALLLIDHQLSEAEPYFTHADRVLAAQPDPTVRYRMQWLRVRGLDQAARGNFEAAARFARESLERVEKERGATHPETGGPALDLAHALEGLGRKAEALEMYDRYVTAERHDGGNPRRASFAAALLSRSQLLEALGRRAEAAAQVDEVLTRLPELQSGALPAAQLEFRLAEALAGRDPARALTLMAKAREDFVRADAPEEVARADAWLSSHDATKSRPRR